MKTKEQILVALHDELGSQIDVETDRDRCNMILGMTMALTWVVLGAENIGLLEHVNRWFDPSKARRGRGKNDNTRS